MSPVVLHNLTWVSFEQNLPGSLPLFCIKSMTTQWPGISSDLSERVSNTLKYKLFSNIVHTIQYHYPQSTADAYILLQVSHGCHSRMCPLGL